MTKYIVRHYWTGSYCSGWCDSCPFDTLDEAKAYLNGIKGINGPWQIVERTETVLAAGRRRPE